MPFFPGVDDWYGRFYEELKTSRVREAELTEDDGTFDVAMLGGSALQRITLSTTDELKTRLGAITGKEVHVFNLSRPALSSYDSLKKYDVVLSDKKFDLIVFYHAINETRMNNCPRDVFRDDYGHGVWYRKLQVMEEMQELMPYFVLPYTARYTFLGWLGSRKFRFFVPRHRPNKSWLAEGGDIKTAKPFRDNLRRLIEAARDRNTPVLLMTFAWYVPDYYTLAKFKAKQLDYDGHKSAIEIWGEKDHVIKGVEVHNEIIREFRSKYDHVIFFEAEKAIPKTGEYFHDICHLNEAGKLLFVEKFMPSVAAFLTKSAPAAATRPAP